MARSAAKKSKKSKTSSTRKRGKLPKRKAGASKKKKVAKKKTAKKKLAKKKVAKKKTKKKAAKKTATKKKTAKKTTKSQLRKTASPKKLKAVSTPVKTQSSEMELPRPLAVVENKVGVGDMAPNFRLLDQNGVEHSLEQYRGKNVVLYFYPKDDTPGCTKEACNFRDQLASFEAFNTSILGVSFDDQDSHQKFIEKYQLNFPLLCDVDKEVAEAYGVYVEKNMYGRTYMGIERSTFIIDREGQIAAAFRGVKVDGHNEELLAELEKLA